MTQAYIALGSNLNNPVLQVQNAINAIASLPASQLLSTSSFYRTPPYGPKQPDYLNAVVTLETQLSPETLLDHTQCIERKQGRIRKAERWGARSLDLDILLFGDLTFDSERLTIPHYDMKNRAFMLLPLLETAPTLCFPDGIPVATYLAQLDSKAIKRW